METSRHLRFSRSAESIFTALTVLLVVWTFLALRGAPLLADEAAHYMRIRHLIEGRIQWGELGAMVPGYHLLVSGILIVFGGFSAEAARLVSLFFGLGSSLAAFLIARTFDRETAVLRALQYTTLPIVMPFFPLLYTDVTSLCFVLFAAYAARKRMPLLSATIITAAIGIRQNNVFFVPLLPVFLLSASPEWQKLPDSVSCIREPGVIKTFFRGAWPFLIPCLLFLFFTIENGSPVLNKTPYHPFPALYLGNLWLTLALAAILFLPLALSKIPAAISFIRRSPSMSLLLALFTGILFTLTFSATHPFNEHPDSFRGMLLLAVSNGGWPKLAFALLILAGLFMLLKTELHSSLFLFLYPLSVAFLSTLWLIDNRYAMIPLTLFLLVRKPLPRRMETLQYLWNVLLCVLVFT